MGNGKMGNGEVNRHHMHWTEWREEEEDKVYLLGRSVVATLSFIKPPSVNQPLQLFLLTELQHCKSDAISVHSKYTRWAKKVSQHSLHITSSNIVRFSKFFHCHILLEICNKAVIKYPTSPQKCCHTTL